MKYDLAKKCYETLKMDAKWYASVKKIILSK